MIERYNNSSDTENELIWQHRVDNMNSSDGVYNFILNGVNISLFLTDKCLETMNDKNVASNLLLIYDTFKIMYKLLGRLPLSGEYIGNTCSELFEFKVESIIHVYDPELEVTDKGFYKIMFLIES